MGTISKALSLLSFFSETTPELNLIEFQKLSSQNKATVHRHLVELVENGFLEQNQTTRKYRLGAAVMRLATVRESTFPIRRIVKYHVDRLASEIEELVHVSLIQGKVMSPIYAKDVGHGGTRVYFNEAEVLPIHATSSGIAGLAFGSPTILKSVKSAKLKSFTKKTVVDKDALDKLVLETRAQGFAEADQSYEVEVSSVAVPIFENGPFAIGSIAIAVPTSRMDEKKKHKFLRELWEVANAISNDLGSEVPQDIKTVWKLAE